MADRRLTTAAAVVALLGASTSAQQSRVTSADVRHDPPSIALGPVFARVALSKLFPDGKLWADATPLRPPLQIKREFEISRPTNDEELQRFVSSRFALDRDAPARVPRAGLDLRAHIQALWPILTREDRAVSRYSSLLPLPHPYVVPGGRFREIYYWDSYFTMLGFGPGQAGLRRNMVDNFAYLIRVFGHVPNGSRTYYLSRSQPPFFFKMVELTDPTHPQRAYARYLSGLRAEYDWWMSGEASTRIDRPVRRVVRMPDGSALNRYWDDRDTPRDESYRADVAVAAAAAQKPAVFRELRAAAESGWDFSSRWLADGKSLSTIQTTAIVPPDLNSLLYGLEMAIAEGCANVKDRACSSDFDRRARARAAAIRKYLWNPKTSVFDDYNWRRGRPLGNVTAAALYPLFFRVATPTQAHGVADVTAMQLVREGGLATTNRNTGQQWDAPNGWAPLQWIAVTGLRNYGERAVAERIAARWLETVSRVYAGTGRLLEKYDVTTRQPGGGGEYALQDGFGWTNGVTEALLRSSPAKKGLKCQRGRGSNGSFVH